MTATPSLALLLLLAVTAGAEAGRDTDKQQFLKGLQRWRRHVSRVQQSRAAGPQLQAVDASLVVPVRVSEVLWPRHTVLHRCTGVPCCVDMQAHGARCEPAAEEPVTLYFEAVAPHKPHKRRLVTATFQNHTACACKVGA